jgi:hypothetical protein
MRHIKVVLLICLILVDFHQLHAQDISQPTPPKTTKRYETIRMEGLPFSQAVKKGLAYCRKYIHKSAHTLAYQAMGIYPDTASLKGNETAISLAFVGDIMWMRGNTRNLVTPELKQFLQAHDLVFGNLETPTSPKHKRKNFFIDYITYNEDTSLLSNFNQSNQSNLFSGLSVANNHSLDRGLEGLNDTRNYLLSKGITPMGASAFDSLPLYHSFTSHGLKFGVFAGAWGLNNPANLHTPNIRFHLAPHLAYPYPKREMNNKAYQALQQMNHDQVDVKIIFMHWGFEFEYFPDTLIREEAMLLSSLGADIIVGAHPHVVQPWDYIASPTTPQHSTLCYYSLGNFCSYMFSSPCKNGLIASIKVYPRAAQKPLIVANPPTFVYTHKKGWTGKKTKLNLIKDQWKQKPTWLPTSRWKEIKKSLAIIGVL